MTGVESQVRESLHYGATAARQPPLSGPAIRRAARTRRALRRTASGFGVVAVMSGIALLAVSAGPGGGRPVDRIETGPPLAHAPMWPPRGEGVSDAGTVERVRAALGRAGMRGSAVVVYRRVADGRETVVAQVELSPDDTRWALLDLSAEADLEVRASGALGKGADPRFVLTVGEPFLLVGAPEVTRVELLVSDRAGERRVSVDVEGGEFRGPLPAGVPGIDSVGDRRLTGIEVFAGDRSVGLVGFGTRD